MPLAFGQSKDVVPMKIDLITLIRNIGKYLSVTVGQSLPFAKLTLLYGENGLGKTTLTAILRSLATGEANLVTERKRIGATNEPHVVLQVSGGQVQFQHGAWTATKPDIMIFDDNFVAQNVCSGLDIEASHRASLHELIIGAQGVALNIALKSHIDAVERHNRELKLKAEAIAEPLRGPFDVDSFCGLPQQQDIAAEIQSAERRVNAARASDAIASEEIFERFELPSFDKDGIGKLLSLDIKGLESEAAKTLQEHITKLGADAEPWIASTRSGFWLLTATTNAMPRKPLVCASASTQQRNAYGLGSILGAVTAM
jgi:wobble nucleotide-excising tRNase